MTSALLDASEVFLKKQGNPNWGKAYDPSFYAARPTEFEQKAASLGLASNAYHKSDALREWATKHMNQYYVPSDLLALWGLTVDTGSW